MPHRHNSRTKTKCTSAATRRYHRSPPPSWHRERSARIKAAVLCFHRLKASGKKWEAALKATLRQHPRRKLTAKPSRYVPLSRSSIIRFYYAWLLARKSDSVFQTLQPCRKPAISEADTIAFLNWATERRSGRKFAALWHQFSQAHTVATVAQGSPLLVDSPLRYFRSLQQRLAQLPTGSRGIKGAPGK